MRKLLSFTAVLSLAVVLAGCDVKPTDYTVTQYRPDGTVQQTWHTNTPSTEGANCVIFTVQGEPTQTNHFACGTVLTSTDAKLEHGPAKYTVRVFTPDGKLIDSFDATSAQPYNGCIAYTPLGDTGILHYACGTVVAEANGIPVSPDSPKPYQVKVFGSGGEPLQNWAARQYTVSGGVVTVFVAGDSTDTPRYATGQVLASPLER